MNRRIATVICTLAWMVGPTLAHGQDALPQPPAAQLVVVDQEARQTRQMLRELLDQYPPLEPRFDELAQVKTAAPERSVVTVNADGQFGRWRYGSPARSPEVSPILDQSS
jgi:hypothetical protein